ncbi:MAG: thioesterase family protein [Candidatus Omnitrophota bacterium]
MKFKIYYHHTDCGGVVYYAKYLEFLEEARTEYMAEHGAALKDLGAEGIFFVVGRQEIDYKFPAHYADILTVDTKIGDISRASIEFLNEIKNQDQKLIVQARTLLVCVDKRFKAKSIPGTLRSLLKK